jgi:hypothetical protein
MTELQYEVRELTEIEFNLVVGGAVPITVLLREAVLKERESWIAYSQEKVATEVKNGVLPGVPQG